MLPGFCPWPTSVIVLLHIVFSDVQGPAQSNEPSQTKPKQARPSQALGHGLVMALAQLKKVKAVSLWPRPWLSSTK